MIMRTSFAAAVLVLLYSCSGDANGQKGKQLPLMTKQDSISYAFGAQIGQTFKEARVDSLNVDALAMGIRDLLDSTLRFDVPRIDALVREFQIAAQTRLLAEQQAKNEAAVRAGEEFLAANGKKPGVVTTSSGLQYEVLQEGTGPKPVLTDTVKVNYRGTLIDGTPFDSSYDRGRPAVFALTDVMAGWTEALQAMPVGSRWKLFVPPGLAYGAGRGPGGGLPPYSTLVFEVELLEVVRH